MRYETRKNEQTSLLVARARRELRAVVGIRDWRLVVTDCRLGVGTGEALGLALPEPKIEDSEATLVLTAKEHYRVVKPAQLRMAALAWFAMSSMSVFAMPTW